MQWKANFKQGKELILATCSKNAQPNANIVISVGFADDKLLIADCQMETTINNLQENAKTVVIGGYHRIIGTAALFTSGKYFDMCVKKSKGYKVKHAIVVNIEKVFDLDKHKTLFSTPVK